jgi:leucyl-tRNA synthetase
MEKYDFNEIETKWQKYWLEKGVNEVDLDNAKRPYYNLMMFPYPSAEGLHIGSMYTFTGVDTFGRFKRMQGYDVFEPIGLDAFGIHSENYALKIGEHVKKVSIRTHKHFFEQLHRMGNMFAWDHTVETNEPDYYRWTQWLFVQFFKAGLAFRKKASVKYCPGCKTVVSDEQVIDDHCERCGTLVEVRELEQWFFKITKYADRLSENLKTMNWDNDVKLGQKNWIGKKQGINIAYNIKGLTQKIVCFTTRPDTNFGATFIVIAPEHELVREIIAGQIKVTGELKQKIEYYVTKARSKSDMDRIAEGRQKTGVFTGLTAVNNLNGKDLPVWISDFVLPNFGTGAVVGVPGHDKRDFEFAREFGLEVVRVVTTKGETGPITSLDQVQEDEGTMVNSEFLNGLDIHAATEMIMDHLESKGWGQKITNFNLRDWCVSRQRYWGPPIPMIYCENCASEGKSWFSTSSDAGKDMTKDALKELVLEMKGWYPVEELPVMLPDIPEFDKIKPDGSGKGPLASQPDFVNTVCPHCGGKAVRETDVSDPFVDSCWYFLRYPFTEYHNIPFGGNFHNPKSQFRPEITNADLDKAIARMAKWGPVSAYIGGKEHTVLHLMYARFITMVMKDLGYLDFEEPFDWFFGHGLITKDGSKMSKSKGNVVNPDEYIARFGTDAVRLYLRFIGPFDQGGDWRDTGMQGMFRFVKRLWKLYTDYETKDKTFKGKELDDAIRHRTIKEIAEDLEALKFNTTIAKIMEYVNWYTDHQEDISVSASKEYLTTLALILAPLAPHLAEEFWHRLGNQGSVHQQLWPKYDPEKIIAKMINLPVQVNGKIRDLITVPKGVTQEEAERISQASDKIKRYLTDTKIKKVVFVPDKIINFII